MTSNPASVGPAPDGEARPPAYPLSVGKEIELHGHRWVVRGIHLGALGQESLIHLEGLSHQPGWTGEWEWHPMLFVPEIMLSAAMRAPHPGREAEPTGGVVSGETIRDNARFSSTALSVSPPVVEGSSLRDTQPGASLTVLVPIEPTDAMLLAAGRAAAPALFRQGLEGLPTDGPATKSRMAEEVWLADKVYRAMIEAARQRVCAFPACPCKPGEQCDVVLGTQNRPGPQGLPVASHQAAVSTDTQPGIFALRENEPKARHQPTTPGEQGEEG